jgi:hypothetical protein
LTALAFKKILSHHHWWNCAVNAIACNALYRFTFRLQVAPERLHKSGQGADEGGMNLVVERGTLRRFVNWSIAKPLLQSGFSLEKKPSCAE